MTRKPPTLPSLRIALRKFAREREWQQFHTPKNLAMALCVETAELLEHFQWLTPEQSIRLGARPKRAVADEIADVLIYLTQLADMLEIDPLAAVEQKMRKNARKYPIALARGNARKYNDL